MSMRLRSFTAIYLRSESALGKFKLMWVLYIYKKSQLLPSLSRRLVPFARTVSQDAIFS